MCVRTAFKANMTAVADGDTGFTSVSEVQIQKMDVPAPLQVQHGLPCCADIYFTLRRKVRRRIKINLFGIKVKIAFAGYIQFFRNIAEEEGAFCPFISPSVTAGSAFYRQTSVGGVDCINTVSRVIPRGKEMALNKQTVQCFGRPGADMRSCLLIKIHPEISRTGIRSQVFHKGCCGVISGTP